MSMRLLELSCWDISLCIDMPMDGFMECWFILMLVVLCNWLSGAAAEAPRIVARVAKTFMLLYVVALVCAAKRS